MIRRPAWRRSLGALLVCGAVSPVGAQQPNPPAAGWLPADAVLRAETAAAATITAADLALDWQALAYDSMRGPTPSLALDRTAHYFLTRLQALGLSAKEEGYFLPNQARVNYATTRVELRTRLHDEATAVVSERKERLVRIEAVRFANVARFLGVTVPKTVGGYRRTSLLLAGPHTAASLRAVDVQGRTVLYVPPDGADTAAHNAILRDLAVRSAGIVVVGPSDSASFAVQVRAAAAHPPYLTAADLARENGAWEVEVWPGALRETFRMNGMDLAALRAAATPVSQPLPFLNIGLDAEPVPSKTTATRSPNIVAAIEGSDSQLQREPLVIVVPMDRRATASSDAISVAGLLALAKAFAQPGARPRRPLVFLGVSGGDEAWGSRYLISQEIPWPHAAPCLTLILDLGSRAIGDTVTVAGLHEVEATPSLIWTATLHPELGLTVADTGSVITAPAEASAFASRWIPTLVIRAGQPPMSLDRERPVPPDATAAARVLRLLYYAIHALADNERPPAWTPAARRQMATPTP